jgi:hypothetical protein
VLPCELADRLEHPEALVPVRIGAAADEALVEERRKRVEVRATHRFGRLESAAAAEDCEPGEQPLFVVVEEVVAPSDRRTQRGVALVGVAAALEQVEPLRDPLEQLLGAKELDACGGQLDREREPIKTADQLVHRVRVTDIGPDSLRPLDEQRDSVTLVHRRQVELGLTRYPQRLTARRHDPKRRGGSKQLGERPGCVGEELLQVVEDDVGSVLADPRRDGGGIVAGGTESLGDQRHDECCGANGGERYEDRATVRLLRKESGKLDREPCLTRAAGADDRQQARVAVEPHGSRLEELALAPEEVSRRGGKFDGARRPQRGKLGNAELEQAGWSVEVLESVTFEIAERLILEERRGRG